MKNNDSHTTQPGVVVRMTRRDKSHLELFITEEINIITKNVQNVVLKFLDIFTDLDDSKECPLFGSMSLGGFSERSSMSNGEDVEKNDWTSITFYSLSLILLILYLKNLLFNNQLTDFFSKVFKS